MSGAVLHAPVPCRPSVEAPTGTWSPGTGRLGRSSRLLVSDPRDPAEQEAERVAQTVTSLDWSFAAVATVPRAGLMRKALPGGSCQSAPPGPEDEQDRQPAQAVALAHRAVPSAGAPPASSAPGTASPVSSAAGTPLAPAARAFLEPRMGHDFGAVRIHADRTAARLARSVGALAFTVGQDIYFDEGGYAPGTSAGRRLLAHELTHVVQQENAANGGPPRVLQRFRLRGFPPAEEAAVRAAVPRAIAKLKACGIPPFIINPDRLRYDWVPDLGICGWTFPSSWYVELGKEAFDPSQCCDLASTIAHEAAHTSWSTEGEARRLECRCFGCSC